jgi:hypothetical protein
MLIRAKHLFVGASGGRVQRGCPGGFSYFLDAIGAVQLGRQQHQQHHQIIVVDLADFPRP